MKKASRVEELQRKLARNMYLFRNLMEDMKNVSEQADKSIKSIKEEITIKEVEIALIEEVKLEAERYQCINNKVIEGN